MKKLKQIMIGTICVGSIIMSGQTFAKSPSSKQSLSKLNYYCSNINPNSQTCKNFFLAKQKMIEVRIQLRKEIKKYCLQHQESQFCKPNQNTKRGKLQFQ